MATVVLLDDNIRVKAQEGTTLRTIALKSGASMEFGCRAGECSTCIAHVRSGMMYLNEKNGKENKVFEMISGDVSKLRLMCQCNVRTAEGEIVISYGQA
jgi:ferredoxin